jgi:hypothetical protein
MRGAGLGGGEEGGTPQLAVAEQLQLPAVTLWAGLLLCMYIQPWSHSPYGFDSVSFVLHCCCVSVVQGGAATGGWCV